MSATSFYRIGAAAIACPTSERALVAVTGTPQRRHALPALMRTNRIAGLAAAAAAVVALSFSACGNTGSSGQGGGTPTSDPTTQTPPDQTPATPGWVVTHEENFETLPGIDGAWMNDPVPDDGPFADAGSFWTNQGVVPPKAFRATVPFGDANWLTAESYTRTSSTPLSSLLSVVADPAGGTNHVLKLTSPAHTDASVIRSSQPLPSRYRISLRVGFASMGDGLPGLNGYSGGETAEPWSHDDATTQNGFYWLTILDARPRPHNNTWIHHHRKLVVDSDNHYPAWMEIFDGQSFRPSGEHPVMMIALDGKGTEDDRTGHPFFSYSNGQWQPSGAIRAVDSYLDGQWYTLTLERFDDTFTIEISGRFKYGGQTTYRSTIDAAKSCVWHFNQTAAQDVSACAGANWAQGSAWPDWFMFGDPHNNYYEGTVYYDDVKMEEWRVPSTP